MIRSLDQHFWSLLSWVDQSECYGSHRKEIVRVSHQWYFSSSAVAPVVDDMASRYYSARVSVTVMSLASLLWGLHQPIWMLAVWPKETEQLLFLARPSARYTRWFKVWCPVVLSALRVLAEPWMPSGLTLAPRGLWWAYGAWLRVVVPPQLWQLLHQAHTTDWNRQWVKPVTAVISLHCQETNLILFAW